MLYKFGNRPKKFFQSQKKLSERKKKLSEFSALETCVLERIALSSSLTKRARLKLKDWVELLLGYLRFEMVTPVPMF